VLRMLSFSAMISLRRESSQADSPARESISIYIASTHAYAFWSFTSISIFSSSQSLCPAV